LAEHPERLFPPRPLGNTKIQAEVRRSRNRRGRKRGGERKRGEEREVVRGRRRGRDKERERGREKRRWMDGWIKMKPKPGLQGVYSLAK
jgi:hypothetical protein